jgi:hypothetical protein
MNPIAGVDRGYLCLRKKGHIGPLFVRRFAVAVSEKRAMGSEFFVRTIRALPHSAYHVPAISAAKKQMKSVRLPFLWYS